MELRQGLDYRGSRGGRELRVHAVPPGDRTRSALCGQRVRRVAASWRDDDGGTCPECARWAALARSA